MQPGGKEAAGWNKQLPSKASTQDSRLGPPPRAGQCRVVDNARTGLSSRRWTKSCQACESGAHLAAEGSIHVLS